MHSLWKKFDTTQFRLGRIGNWAVNMTPTRVDSLPYSKIKASCDIYRRRLLASRSAPVGSSDLPPMTSFLCQPTPSYVLSPQLAARLSKPELSSLAEKLVVYERVLTGNTVAGEVSLVVEERDCIPEVIVDPDLSGGDEALYFGHGQIQDKVRSSSASDLQRLLAEQCVSECPNKFADGAETSTDGPGTWVYCNTDQGQRKIARVSADVDYTDDIATASITLNLAVPMRGLDPDKTCPYNRLAALGVESPFISIWARDGKPASGQFQRSGFIGKDGSTCAGVIWAVQHAIGTGPTPLPDFVDHSRVLGASDPDLETDYQVDL